MAPVIENSLAALSCKVYKKVEAGDHTIILGEVTKLKIESGEPVIFSEESIEIYIHNIYGV